MYDDLCLKPNVDGTYLEDLYSPQEAAADLGCTAAHVIWLIRQGRLPGKLQWRRWFIPKDAVVEYMMAERPKRGRPKKLAPARKPRR